MHGLKSGWLNSDSAPAGVGALRGRLCFWILVAHLTEQVQHEHPTVTHAQGREQQEWCENRDHVHPNGGVVEEVEGEHAEHHRQADAKSIAEIHGTPEKAGLDFEAEAAMWTGLVHGCGLVQLTRRVLEHWAGATIRAAASKDGLRQGFRHV